MALPKGHIKGRKTIVQHLNELRKALNITSFFKAEKVREKVIDDFERKNANAKSAFLKGKDFKSEGKTVNFKKGLKLTGKRYKPAA